MQGMIIHGISYQRDELTGLCRSRLNQSPPWEAAIYQCIMDWFDDGDFIKASTSGSTGHPKEILISKEKAAASARLTAAYFGLEAGTRVLLCLPAGFIAGKMVVIRAMVNGWDLHWTEPSSTPLEKINSSFDFASLTPMQAMNELRLRPERFQSLRKVLVGGAAVGPALLAMIQSCKNEVFETYGMTETVSHIAVRNLKSPESPFESLPGVNVDLDSRGCLVIHARHLGDDPVVTNDLADLIDPTHFRYLGRYDQIINTGGVKVIPELIEKKISDILQCEYYIHWKHDDLLGQRVVLYLEDVDRGEAWKEQMLKTIQTRLSKYEVPREIVFIQKFERTSTGKTIRKNPDHES